jgi:hypothetical protein
MKFVLAFLLPLIASSSPIGNPDAALVSQTDASVECTILGIVVSYKDCPYRSCNVVGTYWGGTLVTFMCYTKGDGINDDP